MIRRYLFALFCATVIAMPANASVARIVSLNPCLDAILVEVADPSQIAALSHYAREAYGSNVPAATAAMYPITYESAEEVIALKPDLVLAGHHNSPATRRALDRLGIRVQVFNVPESVDDSIAQVRDIAALVGHADRGAAVAARIGAALRAAQPPADAPRYDALIFQPNGLSPGKGTLADEMLRRTGFTNVAARYGLDKWQNVSLEKLLADPPHVLLAGEPYPGAPTWSDRILRHPAMRQLGDRVIRATFPERLLYCGGPVLINTAAALAHARVKAEEATP